MGMQMKTAVSLMERNIHLFKYKLVENFILKSNSADVINLGGLKSVGQNNLGRSFKPTGKGISGLVLVWSWS